MTFSRISDLVSILSRSQGCFHLVVDDTHRARITLASVYRVYATTGQFQRRDLHLYSLPVLFTPTASVCPYSCE